VIRKEQEPSCGSLLRKGEVFAYVGLIQNLKDLKKTQTPEKWPIASAFCIKLHVRLTPTQMVRLLLGTGADLLSRTNVFTPNHH
jgi:hypothetical protein